jgi:hypothetical protein
MGLTNSLLDLVDPAELAQLNSQQIDVVEGHVQLKNKLSAAAQDAIKKMGKTP